MSKKNKTTITTVPYNALPQSLLDCLDISHNAELENKAFNLEKVIIQQAMEIQKLKAKIDGLNAEIAIRSMYKEHGVDYDDYNNTGGF